MAGLTASQRELGWNIKILLKSGIVSCLAGLYQQDDFVTVADVRRELELCFVLDQQARHPALIPRAANSEGPDSMIVLDENDLLAFPTPLAHQKVEYWYTYHDPEQCDDARQNHDLTSTWAPSPDPHPAASESPSLTILRCRSLCSPGRPAATTN